MSETNTDSTTCYASLVVAAKVRYWEDTTVNGQEDTDGSLIPLRKGDQWMITIDLETGKIHDWPEGTTADIHYKVCDAGAYWLADKEGKPAAKWNGFYVPDDLLAGGEGYGDYIILKVDGAGVIEGWRPFIQKDDWKPLTHNQTGQEPPTEDERKQP